MFLDCLEVGGRGGGVGMDDGTAVPGALTLSRSAGRWELFGVVFGELWKNYIFRVTSSISNSIQLLSVPNYVLQLSQIDTIKMRNHLISLKMS